MAQLRHCDIDGADTGVEVAVAIPVAVVDPLGGGDAVFGAADGVGLGGEDLVCLLYTSDAADDSTEV